MAGVTWWNFYFRLFPGTIRSRRVVEFLEHLLRRLPGRLLIVWDGLLRIAGNHMDEAITNYLKRKYNLLVGERTAERIKIEIGSAYTLDKPLTTEIKGRSLTEGKPKTISVDDSEIREALNESVSTNPRRSKDFALSP